MNKSSMKKVKQDSTMRLGDVCSDPDPLQRDSQKSGIQGATSFDKMQRST